MTMPDGERRLFAKRYNGYCDTGRPEDRARGMRFGCAWSPAHWITVSAANDAPADDPVAPNEPAEQEAAGPYRAEVSPRNDPAARYFAVDGDVVLHDLLVTGAIRHARCDASLLSPGGYFTRMEFTEKQAAEHIARFDWSKRCPACFAARPQPAPGDNGVPESTLERHREAARRAGSDPLAVDTPEYRATLRRVLREQAGPLDLDAVRRRAAEGTVTGEDVAGLVAEVQRLRDQVDK